MISRKTIRGSDNSVIRPMSGQGPKRVHRRDLRNTAIATVERIEQRVLLSTATIGINFDRGQGTNPNLVATPPTDFPVGTATAGVVPQANWNDVNTASATPAADSATNVLDSTGAASGVSIKWQANGVWDTATQEDKTDQFDFTTAPGDWELMAGYLDNFGGTAPATSAALTSGTLDGNGLLISGLTAPAYDVYVYSMNAVIGRGGTTTVTGTNNAALTLITSKQFNSYVEGLNGDYLEFPAMVPKNGNLLVTPDGTSFRIPYEGIQLVPTTPATSPPAAPSNVAATVDLKNGGVDISFTDNANNETGFNILRGTSASGPFTNIVTLPLSPSTGATVTYTDTGISPGQTYFYEVQAFNSNGSTLGATSGGSTTAGPVTIPTTVGAEAHYYSQSDWNGPPTVSTQVLTVDFNWPNGNQTPALPNSNNSSIFTGKVMTNEAGLYTFVSNTDDEGYLYVDGVLVSSDPGGHGQRNATVLTPVSLAANTSYDFMLLQDQGGGGAGAHFEWVTPSMAAATPPGAPVVVPASNLSPTQDAPSKVSSLALDASSTPNLGAHSVEFSFQSNNNATVMYLLQRSSDAGATWTTVNSIMAGGSTQNSDGTFTSGNLLIQDATVLPGQSYSYRVVGSNYDTPNGGPASNVLAVHTPAATQQPGTEDHLYHGTVASAAANQDPRNFGTIENPTEYIDNSVAAGGGTVDTTFSAAPAGTENGQTDPDVTLYPDIPRIFGNAWSAVYTGKVVTDQAGVYTFISNTDDDGYLYVNGTLVSEDPGGHGQRDATMLTPLTLAANTAYDFVLIMDNTGGGAGAHIEWIEPGGTTPTVVPAYTPAAGGAPAAGGLEQVMDTPTAPTDVAPASVDPNTGAVTLSWTDTSPAVLWNDVQRTTLDASGNPVASGWTTIGTAGFGGAPFTDTTAVKGTDYAYRLRADNYDGVSAFSAPGDTKHLKLLAPVASVAGCDAGQARVSWTEAVSGATGFKIEQSTDGTTWTTVTSVGAGTTNYTVSGLTPTQKYFFRVTALGNGSNIQDSKPSSPVSITPSGPTATVMTSPIDYSGGFNVGATGPTNMQANGNAAFTDVNGVTTPTHALELTPEQNGQNGSAFTTGVIRTDTFDTTFDFQFNAATGDNPQADGLTFTIQNNSPTALGGGGGSLGYQGVPNSVAIKFDLYDGSGPNAVTTGVFTAGNMADGNSPPQAAPYGPNTSVTLIPAGINWHEKNPPKFHVELQYDGSTLTETVTDTATGKVFTQTYTVDIPGAIGSCYGYVGFSGATGGANAQQDILDWKYVTPLPQQNVSLISSSGGDTFTFTKDADGTDIDVSGGTITTPTKVSANGLTITDTGAADNLIFTGGTAVPKSLTLGGTYVVSSSTSLTQLQSYLASKQIKSTKADPNYGLADVVLPAGGGTQLNTRLKGDINGDGKVDFKDLVILAANYNTQSGADWAHGDFTYDGKVGFQDLVALAGNYNKTATAVASQALSAAVQVGTKSSAHHAAVAKRKR